MGGICGWQGDLGDHDPRAVRLAAASRSVSFNGPVKIGEATRKRGLHVEGNPRECHTCLQGPVWAGIEGLPRWSDTEIGEIAARDGHARALAVAYERFGAALFDILTGTWAVAVLDGGRGRALLAVDRLGVRPLCYALDHDGGLVFGTTVDSVRSHPNIDAAINPQALFDFLYFTRIPAPETVFKGIHKLMPGHMLWREGDSITTKRYWTLDYVEDEAANPRELAAELHEILRRAVGRSLAGTNNDTVGSFLSGGIDSSTITGLLAEQSGGHAKAFGVGFDSDRYDEMAFARASAGHFGAEFNEREVTPGDIVAALPGIAAAFDEPFGNSSVIPCYVCAKLAREHGMDVLLAGDGGDEIFAGNARYAKQKIYDFYFRVPRWIRRGLLEPALLKTSFGERIPVVRKARNYIRRAKIPLPDRLESDNFYQDKAAGMIFAPDASSDINPGNPIAIMRGHYEATKATTALDRMLFLDLHTTLADDDLRKVGRTAELAGISVRFPLLDEEVVEFSGRVPAGLKLKGRELRHFFKFAMRDFLPPTTLAKSKHGFGLPFGEWFRTDAALQEMVADLLAGLARRDFFRDDFLTAVQTQHRAGQSHYYGEIIWVLVLLELWFEHHMDR